MKCLLNEHSQAVVYKLWEWISWGALFSPHLWGCSEKAAFYRPEESPHWWTTDQPLWFWTPAPRTVRNKLLLVKPSGSVFVMTACCQWFQLLQPPWLLISCLLCSGTISPALPKLDGVLITCIAPLSPLSNLLEFCYSTTLTWITQNPKTTTPDVGQNNLRRIFSQLDKSVKNSWVQGKRKTVSCMVVTEHWDL